MLIPDPEPDDPWRLRLKLLDFGVAKVTSSTTGNLRENTQNSTLLGTPHYMAPEQCRQSNSATAKADVYSLGVIMYELLSGKVPFDSDSATDLMAKHMYEPVPPLQSLVPELPSQLVDIVDRMLQKEPAKRPSMETLTGLLESAAAQFQGLRNSDAQRRQGILIGANPGDTAEDHAPVGTMLVGSTDGTKPVRPSRLRQGLAATAVLSLLGLGLWWALTPRKPLTHPPGEVGTQGPKAATSSTVGNSTLQTAVPDLVHFVLTTEPTGAQVIRTDTEELLGQTPWRGESARGAGTLVVRIQLPNYESKLIPFSRTKDSEQHEVLRAMLPATPNNSVIPPSETETPAKASTKRTKKGNRVRMRPQEPEVEE